MFQYYNIKFYENISKYFFGKNVYILGAYEKRFAQLYNRSYDRTQKPKEQDDNTFKKKVAKARFNIDAETTVGSVGIGYMNVGRLGFMSIDIIRYSFLINQRADVRDKKYINKITKGIYELGSIFKTFTIAL